MHRFIYLLYIVINFIFLYMQRNALKIQKLSLFYFPFYEVIFSRVYKTEIKQNKYSKNKKIDLLTIVTVNIDFNGCLNLKS